MVNDFERDDINTGSDAGVQTRRSVPCRVDCSFRQQQRK